LCFLYTIIVFNTFKVNIVLDLSSMIAHFMNFNAF